MARWGRAGLPPRRMRLLLDHLAAGLSPKQAAGAAGVSASYAYVIDRRMGGVYRPPGVTYSARYLSREERYELARLRECGLAVRAVAARMGRSPSTICRELARNADPRTGRYQPEQAHRLAGDRQRRPNTATALMAGGSLSGGSGIGGPGPGAACASVTSAVSGRACGVASGRGRRADGGSR